MQKDYSITKYLGANLAELLSAKISQVYPAFNAGEYVDAIAQQCNGLTYTQRVVLHADELYKVLPSDYTRAIEILVNILGEENPNETGMFKEYYWVLPIGKFIELYGLDHFDESMQAIAEVTRRNTGEYAIRPFIRQYPEQTLKVMAEWARSDNFHLRRLAAEGCRPKLPWATKLEEFIDNPQPVFAILECLKQDPVKFVQKSVANNIADYLKINPKPAIALLNQWSSIDNVHTQWIIKHATRKFKDWGQ